MPDSNRQTPDDNGDEYGLMLGHGEAPPLEPAGIVGTLLEASGLKDVMAGLYHAVEKYDALIQERFNSMNVASAQTAEQVTELQAQVKRLQEQVGQPNPAVTQNEERIAALAAQLEEIKTQMASNTAEEHNPIVPVKAEEHPDALITPLTRQEQIRENRSVAYVPIADLLEKLPRKSPKAQWQQEEDGSITIGIAENLPNAEKYMRALAARLGHAGFEIKENEIKKFGGDVPALGLIIQPPGTKDGAPDMEPMTWLSNALKGYEITNGKDEPNRVSTKRGSAPPPLPGY